MEIRSTGLQIYEIDHPATQRTKQKRVMEISTAYPAGVEFLAVDLEKRTIAEALSASSYLNFEPDAFPDDVSHLGYHIFENISPAELNQKYFSGRADDLMTHPAAYIIHAKII